MHNLKYIARHIDGEVLGDETWQISGVGALQSASKQQISFLSNKKYRKYLAETDAGAVLVSAELAEQVPSNAIVVADPYIAYAKVVALFNPEPEIKAEIAQTAIISPLAKIADTVQIDHHVVLGDNVVIGDNSYIGHGSVIEENVTIGENAKIAANVTICQGTNIGDNCIIHPGVVIGADGFGIANDQGKWLKIPQIGAVEIGHDVEIGANTTIDRGALENTIIGNGVKLDNQIQIGHNDIIGDNTAIAGCVGIAGSTKIGSNCIIGGGVGISGHLTIADGVLITGMTMVTKSITESGSYSSGIPVEATQQWHKNTVRYRQLDKLNQRVKQLEAILAAQQNK